YKSSTQELLSNDKDIESIKIKNLNIVRKKSMELIQLVCDNYDTRKKDAHSSQIKPVSENELLCQIISTNNDIYKKLKQQKKPSELIMTSALNTIRKTSLKLIRLLRGTPQASTADSYKLKPYPDTTLIPAFQAIRSIKTKAKKLDFVDVTKNTK